MQHGEVETQLSPTLELLKAQSNVGDQRGVGVSHRAFTNAWGFTCGLSTLTTKRSAPRLWHSYPQVEPWTFVKLMANLNGVKFLVMATYPYCVSRPPAPLHFIASLIVQFNVGEESRDAVTPEELKKTVRCGSSQRLITIANWLKARMSARYGRLKQTSSSRRWTKTTSPTTCLREGTSRR